MDILRHINENINSLEVKQIAYPIGPDKHAYYIQTWFRMNTAENTISSEHSVYMNWYNNSRKQHLFTGTWNECVEYIHKAIN